MIDEIAVERVRLFCPEDHWQQEVDVDVVRYADPDGGLWEYSCAADGRTAPSGPTPRCFRPAPSRTGPDHQAKAGPRSVCPGERPKRVP